MKRVIHVGFNQGETQYWPVRRLLEEIGCASELRGLETPFPGLYNRTFDANDPKLAALRSALRKAGFEWDEIEEHIYTDAELRCFPFLWLLVRRRLFDGGGTEFGTEYDMSPGCPHCGTGAVQISPLMVPRGGPPGTGLVCATYYGHILLGKELATALRTAGVSGLELRQARSHRGRKPLPWWQMIGTHTMPPVAPGTKSVLRDVGGCPACERDMWAMKPPLEITYERSQADPSSLPDVVATWECYGCSSLRDEVKPHLQWGPAQPLILVHVKVFDIFRRLQAKQADFLPVWFK